MTDITDQERRDTVEAPATTLAEDLRCLTRRLERTTDPDKLLAAAFFSAAARAEQMERDLAEARAEVEQLVEEGLSMVPTVDVDDIVRHEVERLTAERDAARDNEAGDSMRQQAEAWSKVWNHPVMRAALPGGGSALSRALGVLDSLHAAQKGAESNAETPDPADVPVGEPWLVNVRGERRVGLRSDPYDSRPWCLPARNLHKEGTLWISDEDVTPISRLVPEPRTVRYEPKEK